MTMVALQPIAKGQQIFSDYGQLPRSNLLVSRQFGVIPLFLAELSNLSCEALLEQTVLAELVLGCKCVLPKHADTGNTKRRYGYVTDNYKIWDVVEVDIETVLSTVSQQHRLSDREQNALLTHL